MVKQPNLQELQELWAFEQGTHFLDTNISDNTDAS